MDPNIPEFPLILGALLERRPLTSFQIQAIFDRLLSGRFDDGQVAAYLMASRMKGETAEELAAAAQCLRARMHRLETARTDLLDTCGTGGDDAGTFNISTAAALVVAAAGVPVVKHGNRAVSSRSGSADVLAALGWPLDAGPEAARRALDRLNLAFCFAPQFHPAMKHVGPLRKRLGVRTILNLLGPLANPAGAAYQLLGVGRPEFLDSVAGALILLGVRRAFVVCGSDGLDEVTLSGPTQVRLVEGTTVTSLEWRPADFNLEPCTVADLRADSTAASAEIIRDIADGTDGPPLRTVLANAAAALLVAGRAQNLAHGVDVARKAVQSGAVRQLIQALPSVALT